MALRAVPRKILGKAAVHLGKPDVRFALYQLRRFGFAPRQALDAGAYHGEWARLCVEVWPEAYVLCIEPQEAPQQVLKQVAHQHAPRITLKQGLLGGVDSDAVPFTEVGTGSSVLISGQGRFTRPMWRIYTLIDEGLPPPDFVKIDVQGYELEVLKGFERHLPSCQVLQVELSLLPLAPGSPLLCEALVFLQERGFVMFDVDELIRAPSDGAVWQIDALFCREDSPLRGDRSWRRVVGP